MQLLFNIILSFVLYCQLVFSVRIIYSSFLYFQFSHAISVVLGSYFLYTTFTLLSWPFWIALFVSCCTCILVMLIMNEWVYKPLQKRKETSWWMMMASLGLYVILQNSVSMIWGDRTLSFRTWEIKVGYEFYGAYITDVQVFTIASCLLLIGVWLFIERTNIGREIKAVSMNPDLSSVLGVSNKKVKSWSLTMGTGLAACVGVLIAADTDMTPTMGFDWLMYGVVAMIIGGMGKMRHMIFGALLLATAQHLSAYFFDSKWMNATAYIILVVFLYFRPYGFSGKKIKKTEV